VIILQVNLHLLSFKIVYHFPFAVFKFHPTQYLLITDICFLSVTPRLVQLSSYPDFAMQAAVTAYFVSWCVLAGFVMMNIVLAVLVDSFTSAQVCTAFTILHSSAVKTMLMLALTRTAWIWGSNWLGPPKRLRTCK
jgi:hypothetical protein